MFCLEIKYFPYSDIKTLPKNAFRGVSTLKEIQVSNGAVATLDKNVFGGQRNLKFLRLHNNNITAINRGTFDFGQSLELLGRNKNYLLCFIFNWIVNLVRQLNITEYKSQVFQLMFRRNIKLMNSEISDRIIEFLPLRPRP